jgi:hypothetical protein
MHSSLVRRRALSLVSFSAVLGVAVLAACKGEDKRTKVLASGATRDSVLSSISHDAKNFTPSDTYPNVYSREEYLMKGKHIEVLYFNPENHKFRPSGNLGVPARESLPPEQLTPLVLIENQLVGKGWSGYDSIAKIYNLPTRKHP